MGLNEVSEVRESGFSFMFAMLKAFGDINIMSDFSYTNN